MSILYKNARNVRFVLFRKNSIVFLQTRCAIGKIVTHNLRKTDQSEALTGCVLFHKCGSGGGTTFWKGLNPVISFIYER